MAEGSQNNFEFFWDKSSEDCKIIYCDPCKYDNKMVDSEGYCINCEEYLCHSCLQSHKKFKAFRTHILLCGDSMPKEQNDGKKHTVFLYCDEHQTNEVKYYCFSHKVVYCRICQTTKHSTCNNRNISEVCNIESDKLKLQTALSNIEAVKESFDMRKKAEETMIDEMNERKMTYKADLKLLHSRMRIILEKLEEEINREDLNTESVMNELQERIAVSTDVLNHISSVCNDVNQAMMSDDPPTIFAALIKLLNVTSEYKDIDSNVGQGTSLLVPSIPSTVFSQLMELSEKVLETLENLKCVRTFSTPTTTHHTTSPNEFNSFMPNPLYMGHDTMHFEDNVGFIERHEQPQVEINAGAKLSYRDMAVTDIPTTTHHNTSPNEFNSFMPNPLCMGHDTMHFEDNVGFIERHEQPQVKINAGAKLSYRDMAVTDMNLLSENSVPKSSVSPNRNQNSSNQQHGTTRDNSATNKQNLENLKVSTKSTKTVQTKNTEATCDITGCLFLTNGKLVLCDHANSNIILCDNDFNIRDELKLDGNVWDVAQVKSNEIVVSLVRARKLAFVKLEEGMFDHVAHMDLRRAPWGVASDGKNIIISYHNNPGNGVIEIRQRGGQIMKQISLLEDTELLTPFYICLDQSNSLLYISESKQNCIICMTFDGKFLGKIKNDNLKWPRKIIVGENKSVAVCSSFSNSIIFFKDQIGISPENSWLSKPLIQIQRPQAAAMRWKDKTMVVTTSKNNSIKLLKWS